MELATVSCGRVRDADARCCEVGEARPGAGTSRGRPPRPQQEMRRAANRAMASLGAAWGGGHLLHGKPSRDVWLCWTEEGGVSRSPVTSEEMLHPIQGTS